MAEAKKCDRCGVFYEERQLTAMESLAESLKAICMTQAERKLEMAIGISLDLCPCCSKSLKKWVKGTDGGKT